MLPIPSAQTRAHRAAQITTAMAEYSLRRSPLPFSRALSQKWATMTSSMEMEEEMAAKNTSR